MKKLFIMRHAKSSWNNPALSDFDRPLNKRGLADAPLMGKIMKKNGLLPDIIISSPAVRAIATAKIIAASMGYPEKKIDENKMIYDEGPGGLLKVINAISNSNNSVLLVGHNPTVTQFAYDLCHHDPGGFPTCAVIGMQFEVDGWQAVVPGLGKFLFFEYPKKYK